MIILVTNDDGVHSRGLRMLATYLARLGDVYVVAPDRNRSAIGHALTLDQPLRADEIRSRVFAVDGTPTDCVNLGIHGLLPERPDLVVSGINLGSNLGDDITYSGTVCAALEATLMGFPAFAVSLDTGEFSENQLRVAAQFSRNLAEKVLENGLPAETFLNVNVPGEACLGAVVTRQGKRRYGEGVVTHIDPRGRTCYWIGGSEVSSEDIPGSDCNAIHDRLISVTPLHANMTDNNFFRDMERWSFDCVEVED